MMRDCTPPPSPRSLLTALLACACLFPNGVFGQPFIVRGGQPRAEIVIAEKPGRIAKLAAEQLQEYVLKISGTKLPIATAPSDGCPVQVYVGRSAHTDRLGVSVEELKHGAFRMASGPCWLALLGRDPEFTPREPHAKNHRDRIRAQKEWDAITGEKWLYPHGLVWKRYNKRLGIWDYDDRGSLNAVCEFLRSLGVRWYMPGELGEIVPQRTTIALPKVDKVVRPDFALRELGPYTPVFSGSHYDDIFWRMRLGVSPGHDVRGLGWMGHGIGIVHGRDEVKRAHPEYFALLGGRRFTGGKHSRYGKPCLSSKGLFDANVRYVRKYFDIYDQPAVSVMPSDAYVSMCQCDLCNGKDNPEWGYDGHMSDYVWDYVDRVAREVYKTHPNKKILCCAYNSYRIPPAKIEKLSPNIALAICQARRRFHDPDTLKQTLERRKTWLQKLTSKGLYIYEYYLHSRPGKADEGLPVFFPHVIADDLRALKGISKGEFVEVSAFKGGLHAPGFNHLHVWLTARLYWDADQDAEALLAEYYENFYGPAADEMKAFIEFCEANWPRMRSDVAPIDEALALLAAASEAGGDTVYGKRIGLMVEYLEPLKQLRTRLVKGRENVPQARLIERDKADLKLDGKLDDKFWEKLPSYQLRELQTGRRPVYRTSFRMAWAGDALCLGIRCEDRDTKDLNITARKDGDTNIWHGDCIELLLETQVHSYYQIAISPAGAVVDADRAKRIDTLWSSKATAAAHVGEGYWSLEVRLPAAGDLAADVDPHNGIAGRRPSETYPWFFNVCRQRARGAAMEHSAFSPTGQSGFHHVMKFAKLHAKF